MKPNLNNSSGWKASHTSARQQEWEDSIELENWMNSTGDVDDFIFYPQDEYHKYHSER